MLSLQNLKAREYNERNLFPPDEMNTSFPKLNMIPSMRQINHNSLKKDKIKQLASKENIEESLFGPQPQFKLANMG